MKNMIITWVTQKNIIAVIIWRKTNMICHFCVPHQLNYGLIYKMSRDYGNIFTDFIALLAGDCKTEQPHHNTDSKNLE